MSEEQEEYHFDEKKKKKKKKKQKKHTQNKQKKTKNVEYLIRSSSISVDQYRVYMWWKSREKTIFPYINSDVQISLHLNCLVSTFSVPGILYSIWASARQNLR